MNGEVDSSILSGSTTTLAAREVDSPILPLGTTNSIEAILLATNLVGKLALSLTTKGSVG
jgi:hypothetical protein